MVSRFSLCFGGALTANLLFNAARLIPAVEAYAQHFPLTEMQMGLTVTMLGVVFVLKSEREIRTIIAAAADVNTWARGQFPSFFRDADVVHQAVGNFLFPV